MRILVDIPTEMLAQIDDDCKLQERTRSQFIRLAIRKYFDNLKVRGDKPLLVGKEWVESLPKPNLDKLCDHCERPFVGTYKCIYYELEREEEEKIERLCYKHVLDAKKKCLRVEEIKE